MGTYTTRLGCQLSFSEEKEADIIAIIQKLNATHKTGQFISNLLRIALENPEILDRQGGVYGPGSVMRSMEQCGISYNRMQFFQQISKEMSDMKHKIDSIYELAFKTYTLGLMGKHLDIEEKSDNELLATFILERQLKDIQTKLGVNIADPVYASNKVPETHEKAEEILEYIIESYTGIVNELKKQISVTEIEIPTVYKGVVQTQENIDEAQETDNVQSKTVEDKQKSVEDIPLPEEDEAIDFGNDAPGEFSPSMDDTAAMERMFGIE